MRRSTEPHALARGQRQVFQGEGDGVTPRVTAFFGRGCHPQTHGIIQEFVKGDGVTASRIGRCARETHSAALGSKCVEGSCVRVSDCAGCHPVTFHVMCRCFANLRVTPSRFSRVSPRHPGCHPPVTRLDDDGSRPMPTAARQSLTAARQSTVTGEPTSEGVEAPAGAPAVARAVVRFTAPTVAREDWCA